ncbi:MAG: alpha/beta hydrolase [Tatlockia sp.]|nr:alpha/beta hydrolase [Tatlockia sp.]
MIRAIFTVSFAIFFLLTLFMYLFQRQLIYFPSKEIPSPQLFQAKDMHEIELKTADGLRLIAWYKPAFANQPTLLFLHGNAGHIGHRMPLIREFLSAGFGVLLLEYRGYGGNEGKPTEAGFYMDARAAMLFLAQQGLASKKIVLYGESLGTAVATKMASEFPVCALILQSPFTSLPAVARYHYPWIFITPQDKYNSLVLIPSLKMPLLIFHGKDDQIVPYSQGLELYNQANEPKKMISIENRGHIFEVSDFIDEVRSFIQSGCS